MKPIYEYLVQDIYSATTFDEDSRFWIEAVSNVNITGDINISTDNKSWSKYESYNLQKGDKVYMYTTEKPSSIRYEGEFNIGGNLLGLLLKDPDSRTTKAKYSLSEAFKESKVIDASKLNFEGISKLPLDDFYSKMFCDCKYLIAAPETLSEVEMSRYCYINMFENCINLTQAPELPATKLSEGCYRNMFLGCTSLTKAPELPAITLKAKCYSNMFQDCTSLTTAPELPATTMEYWCYMSMFENCTSLTTAPELPATKLSYSCYMSMFENCTSLTKAPKLPATTIENWCYMSMFAHCSSLTQAPELPATTLAPYCYNGMFIKCESLTTAPELPATELAEGCYKYIFNGCSSLISPVKLPATKLVSGCYDMMFINCSKLNYIELHADPKYSNKWKSYSRDWLVEVSRVGTIKKNPKLELPEGSKGIPNRWTVEDL